MHYKQPWGSTLILRFTEQRQRGSSAPPAEDAESAPSVEGAAEIAPFDSIRVSFSTGLM